MSKVPYTTDPEPKPLSALRLLGDLLLAVLGATILGGTAAYFMGGW